MPVDQEKGTTTCLGHSALAEETSTNKIVIVMFISLEGGEGNVNGEHETKYQCSKRGS